MHHLLYIFIILVATTTTLCIYPYSLTQCISNRPNAIRDDESFAVREVVMVDDDNEPAPENIPTADPPQGVFTQWGYSGGCKRRMEGAVQLQPKLLHGNPTGVKPSLLQLFELLFPKDFLCNVILDSINKNMEGDEPVSYGELLRWLGLWLLMSTIQGPKRFEYWSSLVHHESQFGAVSSNWRKISAR